jgi:hypothetical protein
MGVKIKRLYWRATIVDSRMAAYAEPESAPGREFF